MRRRTDRCHVCRLGATAGRELHGPARPDRHPHQQRRTFGAGLSSDDERGRLGRPDGHQPQKRLPDLPICPAGHGSPRLGGHR